MVNITISRILNFLFIFLIFSEIIFLIVYPTFWPRLIWFTLPFVFLAGLSAVFHKTIIHAIAFLIVNFIPITIAVCNIFKFDYVNEFYYLASNETNTEDINNYSSSTQDISEEKYKIAKESNDNISKYYIPQHIPVVIILGIFQFTFIILCILLSKIRSWRWIKKCKLTNNNKKAHIIYQLEEALFLITTSFLGVWKSEIYILYHGQTGEVLGTIFGIISDVFGIITIIPICIVFITIRKHSKILYGLFYFASLIEVANIILLLCKYYFYIIASTKVLILPSNNIIDVMFYREIITIGIPTMLFLIILNVNTILCQKYIDENVVLQIYEKEPDLDLKKLSINEWKFVPKSEISVSEYISVNHDKNTLKTVEISFNAESDVMIQTNYPLPNVFIKDTSSVTLSPSLSIEYYYYEITILSNHNIDETIIAVGFAPKNHSIYRLPGCDTHSVGFHSDEGRSFHNEGYTGSKYAEKWGEINDVIGCGYCPSIGQVFFTMNGKNLGIAYTGLFHPWYPTIGSNGVCSLKVNFGQEEFKYKEANDMTITNMIPYKADNNDEIISTA
ncbi:unnamed protein product [Rhizophagus irregularis]|nr:unnamed protein product [Rhizophagus irregularis]